VSSSHYLDIFNLNYVELHGNAHCLLDRAVSNISMIYFSPWEGVCNIVKERPL